MKNYIFAVAALLVVLATTVTAQLDTLPVQVEEFPLSTTSATNCDTIVDNSVFSGTCCALNITAGNGCVLNVAGGNCIIKGQWWTIDYTSTGDDECPPGEYTNTELGLPEPQDDSSNGDLSGAITLTTSTMIGTMLIASSLVATVAAAAGL
mmetsp:Transcript_47671/g.116088  ORF Transcript_47671/g.116088 Transcript_47671/m.116088 type:complete len:151 (-) Transcript_47671:356-808(-)|eukprot:CAMPEP_0113485538 /NCGR_PEP_ID=MMETSP0014_2-20120614/24536_1 /TAXON_ID=2857 /ORGANISM="Nitzschia sp." /LENGTH=150 /DNA_ID=CAMNT_0000379189 /DNA_START=111 /DNA_END=563 /DNA_ORIENTATION=+ /assembly_acc=CAM_ASM_000159